MRAARCRLFTFLLLSATTAHALEWEDAQVPPSARSSALGGMHAALTDELYTIFANPAGLQAFDRDLQISELTLHLSGPIFDIAGVIVRGVGGEDVEDMLLDPDVQDLLTGLHAGLAISGPVAFAYAGGGLGFGFYSWSDVAFDSVTSFELNTLVAQNLLVTGGYSLRIALPSSLGGVLDVGGMLKTTIRGEVGTTKSLLEIVDLFSDPASLISNEPYALSLGVGIDLGVLYSRDGLFSVGLVARDAFTPTRRSEYASFQDFMDNVDPIDSANGRVRPDISIGVRYSPRFVALERVIDRFQFVLDYSDIFDFAIDPDTARNPILHVAVGAEAVMLQILTLRVGFGQGLLSAGLALDLAFADVSLSMFGTELTSQPGLRPTYNLLLGVRFLL